MVEAQLRPDVALPDTGRNVYTSSSCGICGTDSIEAVRKSSHYSPAADPVTVPVETLASLPDAAPGGAGVFDTTGGVHAAGLFRIADDGGGELLCLREDVGRHNAVDKVVGWALRSGGCRSGHGAAGIRTGVVRTRPKSGAGRNPRPGRRERTLQPGR